MDINSITYTSPDSTAICVAHSGGDLIVPWPCHTWHAELIQAWLDAGNTIAPFAGPTIEERRLAATEAIDVEAGKSRAFLVSPGRLVEEEYFFAYQDAIKFRDAGYAEPAPESIACWARVQGWTNQQSADDIIATREQWKSASDAIRTARIEGKAAVEAALPEDIEATRDQVTAQLKAIVGRV